MTTFDDIKAGLVEAIGIANGTADPATYKVHVPAEIDVGSIRRKAAMTQAAFAAAYGFPIGTLREWEQGRSRPDTAARAYLLVIEGQPEIVRRTLFDNLAKQHLSARAVDLMESGEMRTRHDGADTTGRNIRQTKKGMRQLDEANAHLLERAGER